jgi:hypothetical protein
MTSKRIHSWALFLIALCYLGIVESSARSADEAKTLPGSELTLSDAIKRAETIAIGNLLDTGDPSPRAQSQLTYADAVFKIKRFLKGTSRALINIALL